MTLYKKYMMASQNIKRHDDGRKGRKFRRLSYWTGVTVRIFCKANDMETRPRRKRGFPVYI